MVCLMSQIRFLLLDCSGLAMRLELRLGTIKPPRGRRGRHIPTATIPDANIVAAVSHVNPT